MNQNCFELSIAEANTNVEIWFSHISHNVEKKHNRFNIDSIKWIISSKEVCTNQEIEDRLMYNSKTAYNCYVSDLTLK